MVVTHPTGVPMVKAVTDASAAQPELFPRYRTGNPDNPQSDQTFPKAPEAIEIQPVHGGLTLFDRRFYNKLLWHAFPDLATHDEHEVEVVKLRGRHKSLDRVDDSIGRLQRTLVRINYFDRGKKKKRAYGRSDYDQVQLLGMARVRGRKLIYSIHPELRPLLTAPTVYGRISLGTQDEFDSKYGLILYELLQARRTWLRADSSASWEVGVDQLRDLFDVGERLGVFSDFRRKVLDKACQEVSAKTEWEVSWEAARMSGRTYKSVRIHFRLCERDEQEDDDVELISGSGRVLDGNDLVIKPRDLPKIDERSAIPVRDSELDRRAVAVLRELRADSLLAYYELARMRCRARENADLLANIPATALGSWVQYVVDDLVDEGLLNADGIRL